MQEGRYAYLGKNALIILVMVSLLKLNLQYHFIILLTVGIIFVNNITFGIRAEVTGSNPKSVAGK